MITDNRRIEDMIAFRKTGNTLAKSYDTVRLREKLRKAFRKSETFPDIYAFAEAKGRDNQEYQTVWVCFGDLRIPALYRYRGQYCNSSGGYSEYPSVYFTMCEGVDYETDRSCKFSWNEVLDRIDNYIKRNWFRSLATVTNSVITSFIDELIQEVGLDGYDTNRDTVHGILDTYRDRIDAVIREHVDAGTYSIETREHYVAPHFTGFSIHEIFAEVRAVFVNECLEKVASGSFVQLVDLQEFNDISDGMFEAKMMVERMDFSKCTLRHMIDSDSSVWEMFQRWASMHPEIAKRLTESWFTEYSMFDDEWNMKFDNWSEDSRTYDAATMLIDSWAILHPEIFE